jgi:hypothetical protein
MKVFGAIWKIQLTMNWITNHFRRYLQRRPWDFCWRIGVEIDFKPNPVTKFETSLQKPSIPNRNRPARPNRKILAEAGTPN